MKKKLVFLTGAGMSVESGFKTFRGNDGLWENYPVEQVATHEGWEKDPTLESVPSDFIEKWGCYISHFSTADLWCSKIGRASCRERV